MLLLNKPIPVLNSKELSCEKADKVRAIKKIEKILWHYSMV